MQLEDLKHCGIRWSAIDFENKFITIRHTVTKVTGRGNNQKIHSKEFTKNNDIRTLPLLPEVEKMLLEHKQKIEQNKKFYGNSYYENAKDYVCVTPEGELLRPDFVTSSFNKILKANNLRHIKYHRTSS